VSKSGPAVGGAASAGAYHGARGRSSLPIEATESQVLGP